MKLLVTGGAGYVGSVCAKVLLEQGHQVVVVDDLSTGNADAVPDGAVFVHDDMVNAAGSLLRDGSCDGVLHFAATAGEDAEPVVGMLRAAGAQPGLEDAEGVTAAGLAELLGHTAVSRALLLAE